MEKNFNTITLEKMKFGANRYITRELLQSFAIEPNIDIDELVSGDICLMITQEIMGEHLKIVDISYSADWWQAVKQRFAPAWFTKRWPIKLIREHIDVMALYPKISLPKETHYVNVIRNRWLDYGEDIIV